MSEPKTLLHEPENEYVTPPVPPPKRPENRQQRLMVGALVMLLAALVLLLYKDRDFWFPETQESEELLGQAAAPTTAQSNPPKSVASLTRKQQNSKARMKETVVSAAAVPPMTTITQRTVLPPLEVEIVAGNNSRTIHPGTNSVRVDLQPNSPPQAVTVGGASADTSSRTMTNAAERVQISANTAEVVNHPVTPAYPLLARQMKVQGSVVLQALISRDGTIQDLHVVSGPPILASAAQEAVKQWHFKPHYLGSEAVETQARITVNFTISTN